MMGPSMYLRWSRFACGSRGGVCFLSFTLRDLAVLISCNSSSRHWVRLSSFDLSTWRGSDCPLRDSKEHQKWEGCPFPRPQQAPLAKCIRVPLIRPQDTAFYFAFLPLLYGAELCLIAVTGRVLRTIGILQTSMSKTVLFDTPLQEGLQPFGY